ncbi:SIS domain-containing protein [Companilactobacillus huachuanensis]|uniref:SIS domain-containing protein n=1 Tax=Companilactobacillus huachuanensis TaxID=2559914 RepID=A0ABW1RQC8_9LACO|nr:SIS domain-containing protein [Companilactobacillus huachuanensis]
MTKPTMLTYINQEPEILSTILATYPEQIDPVIKNAPATKHWLILATGSSINAAYSAKLYLQKMTGAFIDIEEPYNYLNYEKINPDIDLVIGISQSGQSTATISALKKVIKQNHPFSICVTSRPDTELPMVADTTLDILTGSEKVGYVTLGYNATVLSLMLLGLRYATKLDLINSDMEQSELMAFKSIVQNISPTIEKSIEFFQRFATDFQLAPQFTAIGCGAVLGTLKEMQTKFTEVIRIPSNGFELETFMHGPYLGVHENHRQFFIETNSNSAIVKKQLSLKQYESRSTTHIFTISLTGKKPIIDDGQTLELMNIDDELKSPLLAVIPFQIFAWYIAKVKGINLPHLIFNDFSDIVHNKTEAQQYV